MANLKFDGLKVLITKENNLEEVLIDFWDFKSNLTTKPLIDSSNQESILDKYNEILNIIQSENKNEDQNIILIITLILKKLINMNKPIKMLEIGSLDGWMSKYFAQLLRYFNEDNKLVCIDSFDNQVENRRMFKFTNSFELYKNNIDISNSADIVNTIISNPIDMLDVISNDSFDIIFINHKYSNSIYINKYINKLKHDGLFIVDLKQDYNQLNLYKDNCFDTFMEFIDINGVVTGYSNIGKNEKDFFRIESIDNKYKCIYKNIFDTTKNIVTTIEDIVNNLNKESIAKIEYAIKLTSMVENILIDINDKIINNNLKYYTNEVKNSLMDVMVELMQGGTSLDVFRKDLLDNAIIWCDSMEIEFGDKNYL